LKTLLCHSLICRFSSDSSIVATAVISAPEVVNEADEAVVSKEVQEVLEELLVEMYLLSEVLFFVLLLLEFGVFGDVRDVL
jgi:heme/copper-type cytochrome/quinol oxidase subunit 3